MDGKKTRVLVVDDSAIVRKVLSEIIGAQPDLEVVGTAPDPYIARDKILALHPDVLTLDIEMPRMDGLTFLDRLMRYHPMPVIMISSLAQASTHAAIEAMNRGAVDVIPKPGGPYSVGDLREDLPRRLRAASQARRSASTQFTGARVVAPVRGVQAQMPAYTGAGLIAIGASTGGTQAIEHILTGMPAAMPPIVISQHIPAGFSTAFAQRLNKICQLEVAEAKGGEVLRPGLALVAPGNRHLVLERAASGGWRAQLDDGERVCYQRPSVDVMFRSVARISGKDAVGVILTGMGSDGAEGMLAMKQTGSETFAQDEQSCVVFGMPREAIRRGAACHVLPLQEIGAALVRKYRRT